MHCSTRSGDFSSGQMLARLSLPRYIRPLENWVDFHKYRYRDQLSTYRAESIGIGISTSPRIKVGINHSDRLYGGGGDGDARPSWCPSPMQMSSNSAFPSFISSPHGERPKIRQAPYAPREPRNSVNKIIVRLMVARTAYQVDAVSVSAWRDRIMIPSPGECTRGIGGD